MAPQKTFPAQAQGKPKLAVYKFSSCDGCQLQLLNLEDRLLELVGAVEIAYFLEDDAGCCRRPMTWAWSKAAYRRAEEEERIQQVRRDCKYLVAIGACATSGGIQALRNWASVDDFTRRVYATPAYISTLETATPIAAHVFVDFGLPRLPGQRRPPLGAGGLDAGGPQAEHSHAQPVHRVQARGLPCVLVSQGQPCLGPITQTGCGACAQRATGPATAASDPWSSPISPRWAVGSPRSSAARPAT